MYAVLTENGEAEITRFDTQKEATDFQAEMFRDGTTTVVRPVDFADGKEGEIYRDLLVSTLEMAGTELCLQCKRHGDKCAEICLPRKTITNVLSMDAKIPRNS